MIQSIKSLVEQLWFYSLEPYWGTLGQIKQHFYDSKTQPSLEQAINKFKQRWPEIKSQNTTKPIFIFSAGWRSGSTLLQRLITSSNQVMIWGEPYSHNHLIDSLSQPLRGITDVYPRQSWFLKKEQYNVDHLTQNFTANLYPDIQYLLESHIAFLENLFAIPANNIGFDRWGIKDVRLNIESAIYLNWLFPQAKFLFLYRNPYDAYTSFAGSYWYHKWPNKPVYTAKQFGENWQFLVKGFLEKYNQVQGKLISYESLCNDSFDFKDLENFLEIPIDSQILKVKIRGNIKPDQNKKFYNQKHLKILHKYVSPTASNLGYELNLKY